jgi:hypothetical protein
VVPAFRTTVDVCDEQWTWEKRGMYYLAGVDDPWDAYARWVSDALALRG